jgi:hypothetical protein
MNFPIIEYEVYYPSKNDILEKLNLSLWRNKNWNFLSY